MKCFVEQTFWGAVDAVSPGWQASRPMTTGAQSDADSKDATKHPETYDDLVWVQCKGYRCLAFTDATGQLINFYTGKKLTDFVKVIG